jgi:carboxylate-amine ligase
MPLSLGIEDELFLHDEKTYRLTSAGPAAFGSGSRRAAGELKPEISDAQIELTTRPATDHRDLLADLEALRTYAADRAAELGLLVLPTGTPILGSPAGQSVSDRDRYRAIRARFGRLVQEQQFSGLHVHVGIEDPDRRASAANALRPWLPVLAAMTANSPFWFGEDTGFASWRTVNRQRWPVGGVPPAWTSFVDYHTHVAELIDVGAVPDRGCIYWDVRLSHRFPTVEVRMADTPLTSAEAVAVACLIRAIMAVDGAVDGSATTLREVSVPAPHLLRAYVFAAARDGLAARVADPCGNGLTTASGALDSLLTLVERALDEAGDAEFVRTQVDRIRAHGTGAARQRATRDDEQGMEGVVRRWALSGGSSSHVDLRSPPGRATCHPDRPSAGANRR